MGAYHHHLQFLPILHTKINRNRNKFPFGNHSPVEASKRRVLRAKSVIVIKQLHRYERGERDDAFSGILHSHAFLLPNVSHSGYMTYNWSKPDVCRLFLTLASQGYTWLDFQCFAGGVKSRATSARVPPTNYIADKNATTRHRRQLFRKIENYILFVNCVHTSYFVHGFSSCDGIIKTLWNSITEQTVRD